jgi:hypothetical protein
LVVFLFCGAAEGKKEMVSPLQHTEVAAQNAETKPFIMQ